MFMRKFSSAVTESAIDTGAVDYGSLEVVVAIMLFAALIAKLPR
jgi:hypothetical protein